MKVELISKSVGCGAYEELDCQKIVATVARHGKIKEDGGKLINYLIKNKHWSPLQHIFFGFKIQTSRAISAQIFRHRSLNFQETSQRYEEINSVEPIELRREHPTNRQSSTDVFDPIIELGRSPREDYRASEAIKDVLEEINYLYTKLLEKGVAKECARMILPMASSTTIHVSGTLRDLLAFINIRADLHTQKEARDIAIEMGKQLEKILPEMFEGLKDWDKGLFM